MLHFAEVYGFKVIRSEWASQTPAEALLSTSGEHPVFKTVVEYEGKRYLYVNVMDLDIKKMVDLLLSTYQLVAPLFSLHTVRAFERIFSCIKFNILIISFSNLENEEFRESVVNHLKVTIFSAKLVSKRACRCKSTKTWRDSYRCCLFVLSRQK